MNAFRSVGAATCGVVRRLRTSPFRHSVQAAVAVTVMSAGCGSPFQPLPDRATRMTHGYTYYLDGAGGGQPLRNWAGGVRQGLLDAGYNGAGEVFTWETGAGVAADQGSSVEYKRGKARELAGRIQTYAREYPGRPIHLIGLSAGTAVAVFTLESLPESCSVDNVILLGSSMSSDHDLTAALRRVRGHLYVFTSDNDAVLRFLVPSAGSADRVDAGERLAGLRGFMMPARATPETRQLYAKVKRVPWTREFERDGNYGGHTDAVNAAFVRDHIAPLLPTRSSGQAAARR